MQNSIQNNIKILLELDVFLRIGCVRITGVIWTVRHPVLCEKLSSILLENRTQRRHDMLERLSSPRSVRFSDDTKKVYEFNVVFLTSEIEISGIIYSLFCSRQTVF